MPKTYLPFCGSTLRIFWFNIFTVPKLLGWLKKIFAINRSWVRWLITYRWSIDLIIMEYWLLSSREIFMDLHLGIFFDKSGYMNTAYHFPSMRSIIRSPTAVKFRGQGPLPTSNARVCGTIKIAAKLKINSWRLSLKSTQNNSTHMQSAEIIFQALDWSGNVYSNDSSRSKFKNQTSVPPFVADIIV